MRGSVTSTSSHRGPRAHEEVERLVALGSTLVDDRRKPRLGMDEKTTTLKLDADGDHPATHRFEGRSRTLGTGVTITPAAKSTAHHFVVMGVAGVGKTAVAERLAASFDLLFTEGDDYHPRVNVEKMTSGTALTDDDRWPWLEALADWTRERGAAGDSTVLTCSALRKAYRDVLRKASFDTFFIHLSGAESLLRHRMELRQHFMPAALLRSQLDTLEPLEPSEVGVTIDVAPPVDEVVDQAVAAARSVLED